MRSGTGPNAADDEEDRNLLRAFYGVITETRISVELGQFARDSLLADSVREICGSHASDERVHASQFRALGVWLWNQVPIHKRPWLAAMIASATVARSMPDLDRCVRILSHVTGVPHADAQREVYSRYSPDLVIEEMLVAARPTITYFGSLTDENFPFEQAVEEERCSVETSFNLTSTTAA